MRTITFSDGYVMRELSRGRFADSYKGRDCGQSVYTEQELAALLSSDLLVTVEGRKP